MNTQYFVPVTDELIYNHPEQIEGPLVPYEAGMECHEWLSIEINPDESVPVCETVATKKAAPKVTSHQTKSGLRLVYSAAS